MWEPITTVDQLVARFESSTLDYKTTYDLSTSATRYDIAKDVAAFANAYGGSLIVGVLERGGKVVKLEGVADVSKLTKEVATALQRHCEPCPSTPEEHEITVSPSDAARLLAPRCPPPSSAITLVTLNVRPDPRSPIGVKPLGAGSQAMAETYRFPVRVDDHTRFMPPTELPMWMNSHERRIAIQLRTLGPRAKVRAFHLPHGGQDGDWVDVNLEAVDEANQIAVFTSETGKAVANVPLTFISAVWVEPFDETCSVQVDGTLFAGSSPRYAFKPRRG
jgi:hypothetical protein